MTGEETLKLVVELLDKVPTKDEAGPLCRRLAEWIRKTSRLRETTGRATSAGIRALGSSRP